MMTGIKVTLMRFHEDSDKYNIDVVWRL